MGKVQKLVVSIICLAAALCVLITSVFGWFYSGYSLGALEISGSSKSSYFASGDGSEANPYILNKPIHLYNLAWLQYMGTFNETKTTGEGDSATTSVIKQYYFKITDNLNMTGYVLPPIGTVKYPFVGNLDGGSHTISNLTVSNAATTDSGETDIITKIPKLVFESKYANIIGFFGVVGECTESALCSNSLNNVTYSSTVVSVKDLYLDKITISTATKPALVGLVAGYVNANMSQVGVLQGAIKTKSGTHSFSGCSLSQSALIGKSSADVSIESSVKQGDKDGESEGEEDNFGGSIDMYTLNRRLTYIFGGTNGAQYFSNIAINDFDNRFNAVIRMQMGTDYYLYVSENNVTVPDTAISRRTAYIYGGSYLPLNVDTTTMFADEEELAPLIYDSVSYNRYTTAYYKDTSKTSEAIEETNTGYFVSGKASSSNQATAVVGRAEGIADSVILSSNTTATVYLYSRLNGSTTYLIGDSSNGLKAGTTKSITNTNGVTITPSVLSSSNFSRYDTVRTQFLKSLTVYKDSSNTDRLTYNGLHFGEAISASSSINGTNVSIEKTNYSSYKLLNSSFNFHVSGTGFITAIVANVFAQNSTTSNQMFQLYKIDRTESTTNNKLTSTFSSDGVKQIVKSYGVTNSKGKLTNVTLVDSDGGTYSSGTANTSNDNLKYSSDWYSSDLQEYSMYYIEIPVVKGDYAIGCNSAKGAYFLYLDIGANGSGSNDDGDGGGETKTYTVKDINFVTYIPTTTIEGYWENLCIVSIQIDLSDVLNNAACFYFLRIAKEDTTTYSDTLYCYYTLYDSDKDILTLTGTSKATTTTVSINKYTSSDTSDTIAKQVVWG